MERVSSMAAIAAALLVLGAGWWFGMRQPPAAPRPPVATVAAEPVLTVHVSGAVRAPGLVEVPGGARVADALAGAGGAAPSADLAAVNLAAPVRDGEQITVPARGLTGSPAGDGKVRINMASAAELEQLPGVGPVLARRIADHRDEHGPFAELEDLLDVPGIGEAKLEGLRDAAAVP